MVGKSDIVQIIVSFQGFEFEKETYLGNEEFFSKFGIIHVTIIWEVCGYTLQKNSR